ncbi:MAG: HNH endonuclease signature motif containing protein, partial [Ilumatobacter sp.]
MNSTTAAGAAWCALSTTDPSDLDRDGIADFLRSISAVRAACDAAEVLAVRRTRELSAAGHSGPAENVLADHTGRSSRSARDAAAREEACQLMPAFESALTHGQISAGHLDVAAAAHARLTDDVAEQFAAFADDLVARSQQLGVDAFDRECRDLARHLATMNDRNAEVDELERQRAASSVKRWVDRGTGMCNTLISLDPLRDATMWKAINQQVGRERARRLSDGQQPLTFAALQARAVVDIVTRRPAHTDCSASDPDARRTTNASGIRLPEISILCDLDTLVTGIRSTGAICETDDGVELPPDVVRRMACDAHIIPIVLGTNGEVLDQGRRERTATPAQRNALAAMHRGCAFPGCTVGFSDCRIHHVRWWWEHNGPTDIDNLLPVCEKHH